MNEQPLAATLPPPPAVCEDCDFARFVAHHGFTAGCAGCCARAASRSPHFARVRTTGAQDRAYRALLEQFALTHQQVKDAAASDALNHQAAGAAQG